MNSAYIRFYGQLNDFHSRKAMFQETEIGKTIEISVNQSVKDLIESLGVPHCEVDLIIVNGLSVGFDYTVNENDKISVYPEFTVIDIKSLTKLSAILPEEIKFVTDVHLGKLTKYLRLLGFDTFYENDSTDIQLIEISNSEKRILLTRDVGLLKNNRIIYGYWLRNTDPYKQIYEVVNRFHIKNKTKPFTFCLTCNGKISIIKKEKIIERLEPKTIEFFDEFYICDNCRKIYWKGSHLKKMDVLIKRFSS